MPIGAVTDDVLDTTDGLKLYLQGSQVGCEYECSRVSLQDRAEQRERHGVWGKQFPLTCEQYPPPFFRSTLGLQGIGVQAILVLYNPV